MINDKFWLDGLNPEQLASAEARGHICVVARAGTGKTKGLVARVIDQVIGEGRSASKIILFTFTNLAADEMRKRLILMNCTVPYYTGTFHRVCNKLMKAFDFLYGNRTRDVMFLDEEAVRTLVRDHIVPSITPEDMQIMMDIAGGEDQFPKMANIIKGFSGMISSLKSCVIGPQDIRNNCTIPDWIQDNIDKNPLIWHMVQNYYSLYEELMFEKNLMDFDDMINIPLKVMESNEHLREIVSTHFDTILVDEHQDSSVAQVRLLNALSKHAELYTVGDDGQSIYGWRGADVGFIRDRMKEPDVQSVMLFRNYRSCSKIIELADIILSYDHGISEVKIKASGKNANKPNKPVMTAYNTVIEELDGTTKKIKTLLNEGANLSDIAVLCRTRQFASMMGNQLAKGGVAFKSNEFSLWEAKDIKFIMSILMIGDNPDHPGNTAILHNLLEGPIKVGVGKAGIKKIKDKAEKLGLIGALEDQAKKNTNLKKIVDLIFYVSENINARDLDYLLDIVYVDSGLRDKIYEEKQEAKTRLDSISLYSPLRGKIEEDYEAYLRRIDRIENEFKSACFETSFEELKTQSIIGGQARDKSQLDAVNVLTIHSAKGLEFKHVFIIGCTDSMMGTEDSSALDFGEACRLLYVAITRAEESLDLSYSSFVYNKPQEMCHLFRDVSSDIMKMAGTQSWRTRHY